MEVAEEAAWGERRRKPGRIRDKGFSVVSCLRAQCTARKTVFLLQPQNWIALVYLQEKQSSVTIFSPLITCYTLREGEARAPAESGANSSRLAQTVSFPPQGN